MSERQPRVSHDAIQTDEEKLDPRAVAAFGFLTGNVDYDGLTYDQKMATDENLDGMRRVGRRRGNYNDHNVLYIADLLVGSKYSDNKFFNELIERVHGLPAGMKPDEVVVTGLYMGDFGGRHKNSKWMLKPGLRTLEDQFAAGKEELDKLRQLDVPIVYARSDNDTDIIEEMTYEGFRQLEALGKQHARVNKDDDDVVRQWSAREKFKANPNWPEYYRFTKYVAFPYCVRTGHMLRTAEEIAKATDGEYNEPEREILFDAYRRVSQGRSLLAKHMAVLDIDALRDDKNLVIVGDFEHHINTRNSEYTDLVRHKFNKTAGPLSAYFGKPKSIRGTLGANDADDYDNIIITSQHEAAGVLGDGNTGIHSIGSLQDPHVALKEDGDIFTSTANKATNPILGRGRFHDPSATSIERTADDRQVVTFYERKLMEVSESLEDRVAVVEICDEQIGSLSARIDYLLKHLDSVSELLKTQRVVLNFGGDRLHGRNYSDFPRESGRTGLMGMDQQDDLSLNILYLWLDSLSRSQFDNLKVNITTGNHEWNSGTLKWHGYSFASPIYYAFVSGYMNKGYSREEAEKCVQFHDTLETRNGQPFKTFSTVMHLGAVGIELRHFFGKGGGTGGQPPAMLGLKSAVALGDLKKDVHVGIFGHYHHPSYVLGSGKLFMGAGSLAGITGFEYEYGLRPVISTSTINLGGGLPPQIDFASEGTLIKHTIKKGPFSDREIGERYGLTTDADFDPYRHGLYTSREKPKSALQKLVLLLGDRAAYSAARTGYLENPNR